MSALSLTDLPNELLIDITEYLRPVNRCKPVTGVNAAWKYYSNYQQSLDLNDSGSKSTVSEVFKPLLSYTTVKALSM
jgi:hypothetical protein